MAQQVNAVHPNLKKLQTAIVLSNKDGKLKIKFADGVIRICKPEDVKFM